MSARDDYPQVAFWALDHVGFATVTRGEMAVALDEIDRLRQRVLDLEAALFGYRETRP